jgi:protein N-terminal amidase
LIGFASIQRSKVDLLVLPEMFLSGYMFSSRKDIDPYLENGRTGPTATLCGELARRCGCWVIGGYPERGEAGEDETTELVKAYNSAVVVSPEGAVFGNYRKSFLFDTDKSWAEEGESDGYASIWRNMVEQYYFAR